jgi:hypothetical protein
MKSNMIKISGIQISVRVPSLWVRKDMLGVCKIKKTYIYIYIYKTSSVISLTGQNNTDNIVNHIILLA